MYNLFGTTLCWNYIFILRMFCLANFIYISSTFYRYRNEVFYNKSRHINKPKKIWNPFTYLSDSGINWLIAITLFSNIALFFGYTYRLNILIQYLFYYCFMDIVHYRYYACDLLNYSSFIFLISPYFFYEDTTTLVENYGLFFLNYKIAHLYLANGTIKHHCEGWQQGYSIKVVLTSFYSSYKKLVLPSVVSELLTHFTMSFELFGFVLLFIEETRYLGLSIAFLLHLGMLINMSTIWSFQIVCFYMLSSFLRYDDFFPTNKIQLSGYHSNNLLNYLTLGFLILQIFNDGFNNQSRLKFLIHKYYKHILTNLNINETGKYQMFGKCFNIHSYKANIEITEINPDKKTKIHKVAISNNDSHGYEYGNILRAKPEGDFYYYLNFQKLFIDTTLKKYVKDNIVSIYYQEDTKITNLNKMYHLHSGGIIDNLDVLDNNSERFYIFENPNLLDINKPSVECEVPYVLKDDYDNNKKIIENKKNLALKKYTSVTQTNIKTGLFDKSQPIKIELEDFVKMGKWLTNNVNRNLE